MRLNIFGLKLCSMMISVEGLLRICAFEHMSERQPGTGAAFVNVGGWLECGRCAEELRSIRLAILGQHQPKIQIGFKHIGLGSNRLAISSDGLIGLSECVVYETKIKPGSVIGGISGGNLG